jgi:hypothetical protein
MASRVAQNAGIGSVELTFDNLTTTVAASLARAITQADLDAGRDAVSLEANKQVAICTTTRAFFGKAVAVSEDLSAKGNPAKITVQVSGVMTVNGTTTLPTIASFIACKGGKVSAISGTTASHTLGAKRLAVVTDVWDTDKIDVLL